MIIFLVEPSQCCRMLQFRSGLTQSDHCFTLSFFYRSCTTGAVRRDFRDLTLAQTPHRQRSFETCHQHCLSEHGLGRHDKGGDVGERGGGGEDGGSGEGEGDEQKPL